ncbi:hypothetical protein CRG98_030971 [Punica granatum]|uniref:Reverse transcriptase domain-containing protein n=1 Tax=Punica granatum TaxID=22663 RepID=A0A2I0IY07_PUNGR|nr:hypothetical protein CRG98_030971 [Punica granatum]
MASQQQLLSVLREHKEAVGWTIADIKGISPQICTHMILLEAKCKPTVQPQRRLNPTLKGVVKKEVLKLLDAGIIYHILDSKRNEVNELIPTRTVTGWRVCIDYRKLNDATHKDHFPLPFIDQMLEKLAYYCFLDGCVLKRCKEINLLLNWEKCHFMVREGIVLGHKGSKKWIEVDRAKVEIIEKLSLPTSAKGVRNFLRYAGFYRRFIKNFSKISRPLCNLLEKDSAFVFDDSCLQAFNLLKEKLTSAPVIVAPN